MPILGSSLRETSQLFQAIIKHDTPIYVALDKDAEKKAVFLIKKLLEYEIEIYKIDTSGYEDVGDMPRRVFDQRKTDALPMTFTSYLQYRLLS